jgi:hypothetical protein
VSELSGGEIRGAFRPPPGVEVAEVDPESGALALSGCPGRRPEYFLAGTLPALRCPAGSVADRREERQDEGAAVERSFFDWLRRQL